MHNHSCKHERIKFCKECSIPYCEECGKGWAEKCNELNYTFYNPYSGTPDPSDVPFIPTYTICNYTN